MVSSSPVHLFCFRIDRYIAISIFGHRIATAMAASSPLLGTPYLISQSTTSSASSLSSTGTSLVSPSLCSNLSLFKSHLRSLRSVDDSIILRLNRADALSRSSSSSFSRPNRENQGVGAPECAAFWNELVEGWKVRGQVLEGCLAIADSLVIKQDYGVEKGLDRERQALGRGESEAQVKRRQIHNEISGIAFLSWLCLLH